MKKLFPTILFVLAVGFLSVTFPRTAYAAKLFLSPSSGTFTVGSTFNVSILLNTEGKSVNTVSSVLYFPSDKLQLVSPTIGQSVISVWTAQPVFNNQTGTVKLTGGIPGGVNVQSGVITSLTFRVKQVSSSALIKFGDESRVLANDGNGTDVLSSLQSGVYNLILPPPQGPIVSSETHPDQGQWYSSNNVILRWASNSAVESYSYTLDESPANVPDNIAEGGNTSVTYKDLSDGTHYFHIKSLRDGIWGGVTTFGINVDIQPPAEFSPKFVPSSRTSSTNQIVTFGSSDATSGIAYYEIKVVSLKPTLAAIKTPDNDFFVEATSPYQLAQKEGSYDVIIRAYDNARNYREVTRRLSVVPPIFETVNDDGVKILGALTLSWPAFWMLCLVLIGALGYAAWRTKRLHDITALAQKENDLPIEVRNKLNTLKIYRKKYGQSVLLLLLGASLLFGQKASAQDVAGLQLPPPYVTTISRNVSNQEIFYIGGKTTEPKTTVVIYLQNLESGETFNESVVSNEKGEWFYRHNTFLSSGEYLLWTQSKLGDEASPPSPQIRMTVQKTAIQFGASRLSYESIYLMLVIIFLVIIIGLITFIIFHYWSGRRKHKLFWREVMQAEESVRRGFAVLKRDIEAELEVVRKSIGQNTTAKELELKEVHLLKDLHDIQKHIAKEIWDVEKIGK